MAQGINLLFVKALDEDASKCLLHVDIILFSFVGGGQIEFNLHKSSQVSFQ